MALSKLYVGNLPFSSTQDGLSAAFSAFGKVTSVNLVIDRETGRSRGFAFVEMGSEAEAQAAVEGMNDRDFEGRRLRVDLARPRDDRGPRFGGGGGGGGGGPRYGGGGDFSSGPRPDRGSGGGWRGGGGGGGGPGGPGGPGGGFGGPPPLRAASAASAAAAAAAVATATPTSAGSAGRGGRARAGPPPTGNRPDTDRTAPREPSPPDPGVGTLDRVRPPAGPAPTVRPGRPPVRPGGGTAWPLGDTSAVATARPLLPAVLPAADGCRRARRLFLLLLAPVLALSGTGCAGAPLRDERTTEPYAGLLARGATLARTRSVAPVADPGGALVPIALEHLHARSGAPGRVLVLVHGIFSDHSSFRFLAPLLAEQDDVLLVDLPGTGASGKPDPDRAGPDAYSPEWLARHVLGAVEWWAGSQRERVPVVLVGHSLGAAVVLRMASSPELGLRFRELLARVPALVLIAPPDVVMEELPRPLEEPSRLDAPLVHLADLFGVLDAEARRAVVASRDDPARDALEQDAQGIAQSLAARETRRASQAMLRRYSPAAPDGSLDRARAASPAGRDRGRPPPDPAPRRGGRTRSFPPAPSRGSRLACLTRRPGPSRPRATPRTWSGRRRPPARSSPSSTASSDERGRRPRGEDPRGRDPRRDVPHRERHRVVLDRPAVREHPQPDDPVEERGEGQPEEVGRPVEVRDRLPLA